MPSWQTRFTFEHVNIAAQRFGIKDEALNKVGGFDNLVYSFEQEGISCILRVSHSSHRAENQILAEINWIHYLSGNGVKVCKALPSAKGQFVEKIDSEEGAFYLTAFERALGQHIHAGHQAWGPDVFEEWGYITGQMHACSKGYSLPEGAPRRTRKNPSSIDDETLSAMSPQEATAYDKYRESAEKIQMLPREADAYGICHRDLHHGNFFVDNGKITAFDFDDCGYDYFIQDIAMAVLYASIFPRWKSPVRDLKRSSDFGNEFLAHFMRGYEKANRLSALWMKHIPLFVEKRRSDLCLMLYQEWGSDHKNADQREWLMWNLECIKNGTPCLYLNV